MSEFLSKFDGGELIGLVAVAGGLLCGIICGASAIIMGCMHSMRQLSLKQDMIQRGMSAEEICAIMDAGTDRGRKCKRERIASSHPS
jgi:hypothetical protein